MSSVFAPDLEGPKQPKVGRVLPIIPNSNPSWQRSQTRKIQFLISQHILTSLLDRSIGAYDHATKSTNALTLHYIHNELMICQMPPCLEERREGRYKCFLGIINVAVPAVWLTLSPKSAAR